MTIRTERIDFFRQTLLDYLRKSGRSELPWRKPGITAYEVWVSEMMLQQTQVSRVIGYYQRFLQQFPTVEKLSVATWEAFLPYYEGLGYYARGRNMLRAAAVIVRDYAGVFPKSVSQLEKLPGVGPYTARAVASFAYGVPELAWDTNLKRVMGRYFFGAKNAVGEKEQKFLNERLGMNARALNAALMDFGSALCTARPKCANCPLRVSCRYVREKGQGERHALEEKRTTGKRIPTVGAEHALIFLHERHQWYFSSRRELYQPFILPSGFVTRAAIKDYFAKKYGLTIAVRPPHGVRKLRGVPRLLLNAQILLGHSRFAHFPKSAVVEYTKNKLSD